MANVTRWDPFRWDLSKDIEDLNRRLGRFFGRSEFSREGGRELMTVADWMPTVDIVEDDQEYLIKVEVPEVDKKDVKVTVQNGVLTIQGERKSSTEQKGRRFHRVERSYGTFMRSFALPEDAAEDKIGAEFRDGMLLVHMPKQEKTKMKAIEVKVA